mgnify:CR=1 FL=1
MEEKYQFGRKGLLNLVRKRMIQLSKNKKHREKIADELKAFGKINKEDTQKQLDFMRHAWTESKKEVKNERRNNKD